MFDCDELDDIQGDEMNARGLIRLRPVLHNNIWGGRRLGSDFGYDIPDGPVGECWGISAHPHGDCVVTEGPYEGVRLSELWRDHRELFGGCTGEQFPLLVKLLDAEDDLSIQVHPDDTYAAEHEGGSLGKHECWYVLDADPGTQIVIGQRARGRAEFEQMVAENRWDELINVVPIHPGDFFDIKPGTVHAILGGTLILETQQSSDVTYRLFDYNRRQADGSLRELHLTQAADVIDYAAQAPESGKVTAEEIGGITKLMNCEYFDVLRIRSHKGNPTVVAQDYPFMCLSIVRGEGSIECSAESWSVCRGDHLLAPNNSGDLRFIGDMELIASYVPAT